MAKMACVSVKADNPSSQLSIQWQKPGLYFPKLTSQKQWLNVSIILNDTNDCLSMANESNVSMIDIQYSEVTDREALCSDRYTSRGNCSW